MCEEAVAEKIRYILEPIGDELTSFYRAASDTGAAGKRSQFSNEQVELLLQLESKIDTGKGKDFFWLLMGFNFIWPLPEGVGAAMLSSHPRRKALLSVKRHCDVAAMVYLKSGRIDQVLEGLVNRINDYASINEPNTRAISSLHQVALNEPHLFSHDHLGKVEEIADKYEEWFNKAVTWSLEELEQTKPSNAKSAPGFPPGFFPDRLVPPGVPSLPPPHVIRAGKGLAARLKAVLIKVRYERVKQELRGVSSEINQDKQQLVRKYQELRLDSKLIEAMERIDSEIEETGSGFSYSKSIAFVRNLYEESLRQFAVKVRDKTQFAMPKWTGRGRMGEAMSYFRSIQLISSKEEQLLGGFSSFLSDTGSHRLASEKYEVRIAKNILVEICSYLVDKIDNFLRNQPGGQV